MKIQLSVCYSALEFELSDVWAFKAMISTAVFTEQVYVSSMH